MLESSQQRKLVVVARLRISDAGRVNDNCPLQIKGHRKIWVESAVVMLVIDIYGPRLYLRQGLRESRSHLFERRPEVGKRRECRRERS
jgi:hypothetical protein